MKKILKYVLLAAGVIVLVVGALAAYLLLTFDPNAYKPQIIKAVKDNKQRDLKLDGDIKLTIFPSIGVNISKISLSEFRSQQEFAAIDNVHVSLELIPLLSKHVVVNKVSASGVKVALIKRKDGKLNIDDLISGETAPQEGKPAAAEGVPVKLDITAVSVEKTALTYLDEASGAKYSVKDLSVKTGRIANGVPGKIELGVSIEGNQPKVNIAVQMKATLTLDLEKKLYRVEGLDMQAKGNAAGISNLNVTASGDISANMTTQEIGAKKFAVNVSGAQGKNNFTAALSLPGVESNAKTFKISDLALDAEMKQPEQDFKVRLNTPVEGNIEAQQFSLPKLKLAVSATGDQLPNKSVSSELNGNIQLDAKKQTVAVKLEGGLLQSKIKADASVNNFGHPAIRFNADVDQFDADIYLPKKKAESGAAAPDKSKPAEPEQPFDLSGLRGLNVDGSLHLGALKVANIKASQLSVDIKAHGGQVTVPLSLNLYQGSAKLNATVNAAPATPAFTVNGNLNGVNVGELAKDAANLDLVEGRGNISLNLATHGNLVGALKKALSGTMGVNLGDGAIKGINLQKVVQTAQSLGKNKADGVGVGKDEKTAFSEFKANFKVNNGVAHNDDLSVKAPMLHVTGNGDIDIGNDSLNYATKVTFSKTEGGGTATLPVYLSGSFTDLKYKVDVAALAASVVKQKVEAKKEAVKEETKAKAKEKLKEGLKGLFK